LSVFNSALHKTCWREEDFKFENINFEDELEAFKDIFEILFTKEYDLYDKNYTNKDENRRREPSKK